MSGYRLVPGASRGNDRTYTFAAVLRARVACGGNDLVEAVGRVAGALDAVEALHPGAKQWPAWRETDRSWWAMWSALDSMQPRSLQAHVLAVALAAVNDLAVALEQANSDEALVAEMGAKQ